MGPEVRRSWNFVLAGLSIWGNGWEQPCSRGAQLPTFPGSYCPTPSPQGAKGEPGDKGSAGSHGARGLTGLKASRAMWGPLCGS